MTSHPENTHAAISANIVLRVIKMTFLESASATLSNEVDFNEIYFWGLYLIELSRSPSPSPSDPLPLPLKDVSHIPQNAHVSYTRLQAVIAVKNFI